MPVPYGVGVGDFVAVGTVAWSVYKYCKAAPGSFGNISTEVLSLHAVLKESEETLFTHALPPARAERLKVIKDGCDTVLADLQTLVNKYESLGTKSKQTWDRMKWGNEDIAEIRARLTSNITMLTAFISTSQISVETKLDKFIEEFRQGKREASVASLQTADSLSADDRVVWRTIRKELEDIGISVAAFDANRGFIFDWFVRAVETGAFEEQNEHGIDEESSYSDERESWSNLEQVRRDTGRQIERAESESLGSISEDQPLALAQSSGSALNAKPIVLERNPKASDRIFASARTPPRDRTNTSRVATLLARIPRPRRRLIKAVDIGDVSKALRILKSEALFHVLDLETLDEALWSASRLIDDFDPCPLIAELIARGGNVNYIRNDIRGESPLCNSVESNSFNVVQLLVENGADVNDIELPEKRGSAKSALRVALTKNVAILRLLLSADVNVNQQYRETSSCFPGEVTLIQEAASLGAVPAIELLLEFGAFIDAVSLVHGTALMIALSESKAEAARLLLDKGADANFGKASNTMYYPCNHYYRTLDLNKYRNPIEAAIFGCGDSMVQLLLTHGARPDESTLRYARKDWRNFG
ncbi:hypothetical protein HO133_000071 [Letharia lupina]|uniref:Ankyrin n=1 Tax=Letharia lupina TaxID=560253 RepID=A0A8H6CGR5_9LECA|nr:uncharacterized protein HO133_000071 [Letharia lupina]KAF6223229.1 hypothetical protein HO133_000071 [Letharia lupina]